MDKPPFVANHEDGMRCMLACYRMLVESLLGVKMDWDEMVELTGYRTDVAAWTLKSLLTFDEMGLEITMIENFDYRAYLKSGDDYLHSFFEPKELEWYQKHSDIKEMKQYIPHFLEKINYTCRPPTLADIDKLLDDGNLVTVTLNSRALNDKDGFVSHMILIYGKQGRDYIAQDPGPTPKPERAISPDKLWNAMGGKDNRSDVTGFRLRVNHV